MGCNSLKTVDIPSSVYHIGARAFQGCTSLTHFDYVYGEYDSENTIDEYAFADCTSLKSLCIDTNVLTICDNAFSGCKSLEKVFYFGDRDDFSYVKINENNECFKNATLYFYSDRRPEEKGNYWFFLKDTPMPWDDGSDFLIEGNVLKKIHRCRWYGRRTKRYFRDW